MEQEEKKLPEGLEEAAERWAEKHPFNGRVSSFKAGAEWMKAKMMEGAVEGLPKWKKSPGALRYGILEDEHGRYIQHDGYKLYFDDLLKLPKEDEK